MKCFIASAFERKDVEVIYDRVIKPVLEELTIEPMRVDRVIHNDDINAKILQLMKAADFGIAELTYARPSVYYEAGHMVGSGKPVIFMARRDHFRQTDNDKDGNLTVHFDLRTRNIIKWHGRGKGTANKLRALVRHVISPMVRLQTEKQQVETARKEFQRRPITEQLQALREISRRLVRARGYGAVDDGTAFVKRKSATVLQVICPVVKRAFVKTDRVALGGTIGRYSDMANYARTHGYKRMETLVVCVSLGPIPWSRFRGHFTSFAELDDGALQRTRAAERKNDGTFTVPHKVTFQRIDKVASDSEFRTLFKLLLDKQI